MAGQLSERTLSSITVKGRTPSQSLTRFLIQSCIIGLPKVRGRSKYAAQGSAISKNMFNKCSKQNNVLPTTESCNSLAITGFTRSLFLNHESRVSTRPLPLWLALRFLMRAIQDPYISEL